MTKNTNKNQQLASSLLLKSIPTADALELAGEVRDRICNRGEKFDSVNYIYVLDSNGRISGVLSIKELIAAESKTQIKNIMTSKVIAARSGTHREKVAALAVTHNLKAIPVLGREGKLLGIVGADAILKTLHEEHVEDLLRFAGVGKTANIINIFEAPSLTQIKRRLPWLLVGLLGGMLATVVVGFFEKIISQELALVFFIPIIVYMSDAVGTQTETLLIRALAMEKIIFKKYLWREAATGIVIGLICGALLTGFSFILNDDLRLALTTGAALSGAMMAAVLIAMLMPFILIKIKKDPAFGSGPLGTIISDIVSLVIYFGVANAVLFGF